MNDKLKYGFSQRHNGARKLDDRCEKWQRGGKEGHFHHDGSLGSHYKQIDTLSHLTIPLIPEAIVRRFTQLQARHGHFGASVTIEKDARNHSTGIDHVAYDIIAGILRNSHNHTERAIRRKTLNSYQNFRSYTHKCSAYKLYS